MQLLVIDEGICYNELKTVKLIKLIKIQNVINTT